MVNAAITTVCDMVEHCRLRLDDVSPQSLTPTTNLELVQAAAEDADESELLWTTAELEHYANEAIKETAWRTRCLRDSDLSIADVTRYSVTAGTSAVVVDPRVFIIKRVWWNSTVLVPLSARFQDEQSNDWRAEEVESPEEFVLNQSARSIRLVGIPTLDGVVGLEVIRLPLTAISGHAVPEIPQPYLADCLHWMCHLAYLKNDADTRDKSKSDEYAALFASRVGPRPSLFQLELEGYQQGRRRGRLYYF